MTARERPWRDALSLCIGGRRTIVVATSNADKLRELQRLWGDAVFSLLPAPDSYPAVKENLASYEGNALLKATTLSILTGGLALADDSGLEVEALDWAPGVHSARTPFAGASSQTRNEHLLRRLASMPPADRRARMVSVCALVVPGFGPLLARGVVEGTIASAPAGRAGFGYDAIFVYPPYASTFGEAGEARKDAVSHRGQALRTLRNELESLLTSRRL